MSEMSRVMVPIPRIRVESGSRIRKCVSETGIASSFLPSAEERLAFPVTVAAHGLQDHVRADRALVGPVVVRNGGVLHRIVRGHANHEAARRVEVHRLAIRIRDADEVGGVVDQRREHATLVADPLRDPDRPPQAVVKHDEEDARAEEHAGRVELVRFLQQRVLRRNEQPPDRDRCKGRSR